MGTGLRLTGPCGLALAWILSACTAPGAPGAVDAGPPARSPAVTEAPVVSPEPPGTFARRPDADFDLTTSTRGWTLPAAARVQRGAGLVLIVRDAAEVAVAVAPERVPPQVPVMVEADVVLPRGDGTGAGVWCRGDRSFRNGYAFVLGRDGGWGLFRYDDGEPSKVERGAINPEELTDYGSVRLRLACGPASGDGVSLAVSYGNAPFALVTDPAGNPALGERAGVFASRIPAGGPPAEAVAARVTLRRGR